MKQKSYPNNDKVASEYNVWTLHCSTFNELRDILKKIVTDNILKFIEIPAEEPKIQTSLPNCFREEIDKKIPLEEPLL